MATYDLAYPGAAIDAILNTAYYLQEAGYIFRGSASDYSGTPSKREWVIAPAGFTGFGITSPVPKGSIGICLYNGTAWAGKIINVVTIDANPAAGSDNAVTSGGTFLALATISQNIIGAVTSLSLSDGTASADQATKLTLKLSNTYDSVTSVLSSLDLVAATATKAGLMSAADKEKVDSFLSILRSMTFADTTPGADVETKIVETLKMTVGGVQEAVTALTILAATTSKAGLMSATDKAYIDGLPTSLSTISTSISKLLAMLGYYECSTAAGTAAKTVSASGYVLTNGGCIRIKMTYANTANGVTLNINGTGAKNLYYDGAQASSSNSWDAGDVLEVYYDGTQYQCASGGGGKFATGQKVKETSISNEIDNSNSLPTCLAVNKKLTIEEEASLGTAIAMLINDSLKWHADTNTFHYLIPCSSGELFKVTANSTLATTYAWLTSNAAPVHNTSAPMSAVDSAKHTIAAGTSEYITAPSDALYLYILGTYRTSDFTPTSVKTFQSIVEKIDGIEGDISDINDTVDTLNNMLQGAQEIELGWTANLAVKASDGTFPSVSGNNYAVNNAWVDISGYTNIMFDLLMASAIYGVALYDENKAYLRGWSGDGSTWAYTRMNVPVNGATYIRITGVGSNHSSLGSPKLYGVEPNTTRFVDKESVANSLDVTAEGKVLDARQGKVLYDMFVDNSVPYTAFTWNGGGIKSEDGTTRTDSGIAAVLKYSNYIDVSGFKTLKSKWPKSTTTYGSAFYDSSKNFISGTSLGDGATYGYVEASIAIPSNAKYIRITAYQSTQYGDPELILYKDADGNADFKQANPYFTTFQSYNDVAETDLVKETVFSTTVDNFGGALRRIPSMIVSNAGTVIAATEVRSAYADNSQTGIGVARKVNGEWSYSLVLPYNASTYGKVMNPCFVIDRSGAHGTAGRIFLFFLAFPITSGNNGWAQDATTAEMDCMYIYSDNDGATWSSPVSIKSAWDTDEWTWVGVSPANGCQLTNGALCLPCMGRYSDKWFSGVAVLTVGGSWTFSKKSASSSDNESTCFEGVAANTLYLNCRSENNGHVRNLYLYDFATQTLDAVSYPYDPNVKCQQSISKGVVASQSMYLQSANNPLTYNTRNRMTLWLSNDGMVWQRMIRVNDATTYGYSVADAYGGVVGIIYENSGTITFIDLSALSDDIKTAYGRSIGKTVEERMQEIVERFLP